MKPTDKKKAGKFELAKWENDENGEKKISFTLQKSWKQGENWKSSKITVFENELNDLKTVINGF